MGVVAFTSIVDENLPDGFIHVMQQTVMNNHDHYKGPLQTVEETIRNVLLDNVSYITKYITSVMVDFKHFNEGL